jgi:proline dehydrogenase
MVRRAVAAVAGAKPVVAMAEAFPPARALAAQFVAGDSLLQALPIVKGLVAEGYLVTMDHLGEAVTSPAEAAATVAEYANLMHWLAVERLTGSVEASIKLTALGQALGGGESLCLDHAESIAAAATTVSTHVTIDMEDHRTTDGTLRVWRTLRERYPDTGVVLQARLLRTPDDLTESAVTGARIRICKGAYREPTGIAHRSTRDVDLAYVRAMKQLIASDAYAMIATHDPRMVEIARELIARSGRERDSYEFQFLYGTRAPSQRRLLADGEPVRLYVPYGTQWYRYFSRRLIERPANLALLWHALGKRH